MPQYGDEYYDDRFEWVEMPEDLPTSLWDDYYKQYEQQAEYDAWERSQPEWWEHMLGGVMGGLNKGVHSWANQYWKRDAAQQEHENLARREADTDTRRLDRETTMKELEYELERRGFHDAQQLRDQVRQRFESSLPGGLTREGLTQSPGAMADMAQLFPQQATTAAMGEVLMDPREREQGYELNDLKQQEVGEKIAQLKIQQDELRERMLNHQVNRDYKSMQAEAQRIQNLDAEIEYQLRQLELETVQGMEPESQQDYFTQGRGKGRTAQPRSVGAQADYDLAVQAVREEFPGLEAQDPVAFGRAVREVQAQFKYAPPVTSESRSQVQESVGGIPIGEKDSRTQRRGRRSTPTMDRLRRATPTPEPETPGEMAPVTGMQRFVQSQGSPVEAGTDPKIQRYVQAIRSGQRSLDELEASNLPAEVKRRVRRALGK